jgi:hypothetical protein
MGEWAWSFLLVSHWTKKYAHDNSMGIKIVKISLA